ncbi:hypothetical protein [Undibacterium sp. Tian12W]|uniref:hypothetical protein n=1 Tax=Undibacterium sp. Tian12W TaxID=3413054 RepID=UPI003BF25576
MRKSYVFLYSDALGTYEEVKNFLDTCDDIQSWRNDLPHSFFFVSNATAGQLVVKVVEHFGNEHFSGPKGMFLIMPYDSLSTNGYLSNRSWSLLNEMQLPPKEIT